ncbi:hypothetical protein COM24_06830 [Bacillus toyonensis]|uniref:Ig-like domain-containing protein n=1 Tax=Bacillus cereus group TaxID=86661 RepID=UPI000BF38C34|nr:MULTISPECIES: Ig-like domain-containing protein [Bacillus cereus group]PES55909.1 hypothetical protein CN499_05655 [Bacillus thuringiensis]PGC56522.1 hypothetical protein COM24_06830 [Bacillus toyonensis]
MSIVYKTLPHHTQDKVLLDQEIEITFMLDINVNSLRQENIILLNLSEQRVEPVKSAYNRKVLKVKSLNLLNPNSHYQLQLVGGESGIKDITGRIMAETYELEFYTKDIMSIKPPTIIQPNDLSIVLEKPEYHLTKVEEALYYELQVSMSNTFHNLVWPKNNEKIYGLEDKVTAKLDVSYENAQYYVRARSVNDKGICSSWSKPIRFYFDGKIESTVETPKQEDVDTPDDNEVILETFTRAADQDQIKNLQDALSITDNVATSNLSIKDITPKNKSVNNSLESIKKITIQFSEELNKESVTTSSCYVLAERN